MYKMHVCFSFFLMAMFLGTVGLQGAEAVSEKEIKEWTRHLLPLPHEIKFSGKQKLHFNELELKLRAGATDVEQHAAGLLKDFIKGKSGGEASAAGKLEINIGVINAEDKLNNIAVNAFGRLSKLPNNQQAYVIKNVSDNQVVITALNEKGIFYGVTTFMQLLGTCIVGDRELIVPAVEITDWPDLKERGTWNGNDKLLIPWLSSLKMNFSTEEINWKRFEKDVPYKCNIDINAIKKARLFAFNLVPKITHLNFLHGFGLYDAYPELAGKGKSAFQKHGNPKNQAPCASNPKLKELLIDMMKSLAEQGIDDISVWTSEYLSNCECDECSKQGFRAGQFILEGKAVYEAWSEVRKNFPDLKIRIFYSFSQFNEGLTHQDMEKVFDSIPKEVRVERACYDERRTSQPRDIYSNPSCDKLAAKGYEVITYNLPFTGTHEPSFRVLPYKDMLEGLIERKWSGAYAMQSYSGPVNKELANAHICAIAEWSWNNKGRSVRDFAEAWAVKNNYADAEEIGRWAELVAPVEYDIVGSSYAPNGPGWTSYISKEVPGSKSRMHSSLGKGFYRYYKSKEDIDGKIKDLNAALEIAEKLENKFFLLETKLDLTFVNQAKIGDVLADALCSKELSETAKEEAVKSFIGELTEIVNERIKIYSAFNDLFPADARKAFGLERKISAAQKQLDEIKKNLQSN